ncbi:MAG: hypothetical protein EBZ69_09650, partial [Alphaproteobacteria bacterium]|nr:hypothetical protein [Alphaproteobacteria bacterium]
IMQTARVVAVANAFVAIVSPRAHRPGVSVKQAVDALNQEAGKGFDGRVVIALANYVENRRDKPEWLALTA